MALLFVAMEFSPSFKNNKFMLCSTGTNMFLLCTEQKHYYLGTSPFRPNYFCNKRLHGNRVIKFSIKYFDRVVMTIMKNML